MGFLVNVFIEGFYIMYCMAQVKTLPRWDSYAIVVFYRKCQVSVCENETSSMLRWYKAIYKWSVLLLALGITYTPDTINCIVYMSVRIGWVWV